MMNIAIKSFLLLLLIASNSNSQITQLTHRDLFPKGFTVDYGSGRFAVQDDFFLKENYSGRLPYFAAGWSQFHGNHGVNLLLKFRSSSEIKGVR